jgi:hypothetical protein
VKIPSSRGPVYGVRKHDNSIYLACIGGIILDAAIAIGVIASQQA